MASPVRLVTLRLQRCHAEIDQRSYLVLPQCNVRFTLVTETVCHHVLWVTLKAGKNEYSNKSCNGFYYADFLICHGRG